MHDPMLVNVISKDRSVMVPPSRLLIWYVKKGNSFSGFYTSPKRKENSHRSWSQNFLARKRIREFITILKLGSTCLGWVTDRLSSLIEKLTKRHRHWIDNDEFFLFSCFLFYNLDVGSGSGYILACIHHLISNSAITSNEASSDSRGFVLGKHFSPMI